MTSYHSKLPPNLIDCTPFNLIATQDGLTVIDQEWELTSDDVTIGWVLFRGLYWFLASYAKGIKCWPVAHGPWGPVIEQQFADLGYQLTKVELADLVEREARFQGAVVPDLNVAQLAKSMRKALGPNSRVLRRGIALVAGAKLRLKQFRRALQSS